MRKKILALLMILTSLVTTVGSFALQNTMASTAITPINNIQLTNVHGGVSLLTWKGINNLADFLPHQMMWTDPTSGKTLPAYCVEPNQKGVEDISGGYKLTASDIVSGVNSAIQDAHVYGAIQAGFPTKTPAQLGITSTDKATAEYEAYTATKFAIWSLVHDNYSNPDDWKANDSTGLPYKTSEVKTAFDAIRAAGLATTNIPSSSGSISVTFSPASGAISDVGFDETKLQQTYTVTGVPNGSTYTVAFLGTPASGVQIVDTSNQPKTTFNSGDKFKVIMTEPPAPYDVKADLSVSVTNGSNVVLYGQPSNGKANSEQTYALVSKSSTTGTSKFLALKGQDTNTPTPHPPKQRHRPKKAK